MSSGGGTCTPQIVGINNPPSRFREDKRLRVHETPFESRYALVPPHAKSLDWEYAVFVINISSYAFLHGLHSTDVMTGLLCFLALDEEKQVGFTSAASLCPRGHVQTTRFCQQVHWLGKKLRCDVLYICVNVQM
jgi:hypothetical protein